MRSTLDRLTIILENALPQGAFFEVWSSEKHPEVRTYYFWDGQAKKKFGVPVKLLNTGELSVRTGTEPKGAGKSEFRNALLDLIKPARLEIQRKLGSRIQINDAQTVIEDDVTIPKTDILRAAQRVLLFREVLGLYVIQAASNCGLSISDKS